MSVSRLMCCVSMPPSWKSKANLGSLLPTANMSGSHGGLFAGLDAEHHQMLFMAPSREAKQQVRVPMSALQRGRLTLRTDLLDVYLYIFSKQTVFAVLEARPNCQSIKQVHRQGLFMLGTCGCLVKSGHTA